VARSTLDDGWDVIVVGAGGAGLAAAAEAAARGCKVLVLEKNAQPGGSTACSLGMLATSFSGLAPGLGAAGGDWHGERLASHHAAACEPHENPGLRQILVQDGGEVLPWLASLGVVFAPPRSSRQTIAPRACTWWFPTPGP
jgi:glycine/D-amino acid oxidase-like deaminating enzyme